MIKLSTFLTLVALTFCAPELRAQSTPPTAQDCRVAANKLASNPHSEAYRWALAYGRLAECGDVGARALAGAILEASGTRDLHLLQQMTLAASLNRHPAIWGAALDIAQRRSATVPARVASLQILLRQHDVAIALEGGLQRLTSERMGPFCRVDVVPHGEYRSLAPLPLDYRERVEAATLRISEDPAEVTLIRDLAACVGRAVRGFGEWTEADSSASR